MSGTTEEEQAFLTAVSLKYNLMSTVLPIKSVGVQVSKLLSVIFLLLSDNKSSTCPKIPNFNDINKFSNLIKMEFITLLGKPKIFEIVRQFVFTENIR